MATIRPPTRSPGFLNVPYVLGGVEHRLAVRLLVGVDPYNTTVMRGVADNLAVLMGAVMPNTHSFTRWESYDALNSSASGGALTTPVTGTHGTNSGMQAYKSATLTLTGKGIPGAPGYAVGQTELKWRSTNSYLFTAGSKRQAVDSPLEQLRVFLALSIYVWADFFGQKAIVRATPTVQFNAHIQKEEGS